MKILVINGSPKKETSNTLILTKAFLEGFNADYKKSVSQINIYDNNLQIENCVGCFHCWTKTPGKCVFNDDMALLLEKYTTSDIIIWSFPLYYFGLPSKIKAFMDRLLPLNKPFMTEQFAGHISRYDLSHQKTVVISSGGLSTVENNFEAVEKQYDILFRGNYSKIFTAQSPLFAVKALEKKTSQYLEILKEAGAYYQENHNFSEELQRRLDEPLFPIGVYNKLADASWEIDCADEKKSTNRPNLFSFTKQMAALYNPGSYKKDIVLEMEYTDFNERYQIIITESGEEVIDTDFKEFTTKIETPFTVWEDISIGKISGSEALIKGLYKVKGDLEFIMQWDNYFGIPSHESVKKPIAQNEKVSTTKTNMNLMLIPFITFWVIFPFSSLFGSVISIMTSLILPLIFRQTKFTVYDRISAFSVGAFSVAGILGASYDSLLPLSYLCFALLWIVSLFTKTPLSAHYSNTSFGGEKAFENAIFMKTNAILTLCWGILYLLLSIFTFLAIGSYLQPYLVFINNLPPILLGIFTKWFQNWYPQKIISGR